MPSRGQVAALGLVGAGASLVLVGGVLQAMSPSAVPADAGTVPAAATSTVRPAARAPARRVAPSRVTLPGGVARVVPADVVRGGLTLPDDVGKVGWWRGGAGLEATAGTIVLAGHVDSAQQGLGAFAKLRDLPVGARVTVATAGRSRTFTVTGRRSYAKTQLPASVFDQAGALRLVLVTCTGRFDPARRSYEDNLVVYASPA